MRMTKEEMRQHLAANGVDHLSFSAVADYLKDPRLFKRKWIDREFGDALPANMASGRAYHAGLEDWWNAPEGTPSGERLASAFAAVRRTLEEDAAKPGGIEWGEVRIAKSAADAYAGMGCEITTRPDKAGKAITYAAMNLGAAAEEVNACVAEYAAQEEAAGTPRPAAVEIKHTELTTDAETGEQQLLPTKGRMDKLDWDPATGTLTDTDYKLQGDDPETDKETGLPKVTPAMVIQAACYEPLANAVAVTLIGRMPERVRFVFDLMNRKAHRRNLVQLELTDTDRVAWARLFRGVAIAVALNCLVDDPAVFLPNPYAQFNQDGWNAFMQDIRRHLGLEEAPAAGPKYDPYELE